MRCSVVLPLIAAFFFIGSARASPPIDKDIKAKKDALVDFLKEELSEDYVDAEIKAMIEWANLDESVVSELKFILTSGPEYLRRYKKHFDLAERKYGVSREVIAAILAVESRFGKNIGHLLVFNRLFSIYVFDGSRSLWARKHLKYFFKICKREGLDYKTTVGSSAGAIGIPQFMPSSYWEYAVDGDGDGRADLVKSHADSIMSVANFLHHNGWRKSDKSRVNAVFRYNQSSIYGNKVFYYAKILKGGTNK